MAGIFSSCCLIFILIFTGSSGALAQSREMDAVFHYRRPAERGLRWICANRKNVWGTETSA